MHFSFIRQIYKAWTSNAKLRFFLKACLSIALLVLVLKMVNLRDLSKQISQANIFFLGLALGLFLVGQGLRTWRWKLLLEAKQIYVPFSKLVSFTFIGYFFNVFLPAELGGDVVRAQKLISFSKQRRDSIASVLMDRLLGILSMLLLGIFALILSFQLLHSIRIVLVVSVFAGGFLLFIGLLWHGGIFNWLFPILSRIQRLEWIVKKLEKLLASFLEYQSEKRTLLLATVASILFQSVINCSSYFMARAIGLTCPLYFFFLSTPLITIITMLPASINGIGVRETAYVFFFKYVGVSTTSALLLSFMDFSLFIIIAIMGGILYLL